MLRTFGCLTLIALLCAGCSRSKDDAAPVAEQSKPQTPPPAIPTSASDEETAQINAADAEMPSPPAGSKEPDDAFAANDPAAQPGSAAPNATAPVEIKRDSTLGKWVLYLNQQLNDFPIALIDIAQDEQSAFKAKVLEVTRAFPAAPEIESAAIDKGSADIRFKLPDATFDFEGRLADNRVRGNIVFESGIMVVGWLEPTDAESIASMRPKSTEGAAELQAAVSEQKNAPALGKFVEEHPNSPLAPVAFQVILQSAKEAQLESAAVEKIVEEYAQTSAQWGNRMEQLAHMNAGISLSRQVYLPEIAAANLRKVQENFPENAPAHWKPDVERELTILGLRVGSDAEKQQAADALLALQKQNCFDHRITLALADYAEQAGRTDQALEQNARLSVLPRLEQTVAEEWLSEGTEKPLPSETVARLWKEKHGSTDGLEEYLSEVYEKSIYGFASDKVEPRPADGNHSIALVELFTGAQCPPCVAADVAAGGIEATYSPSDVIVLRYHQHIPGPDPLTNAAAEARFDYYAGQGTPTIALNGTVTEGFGGFLDDSQTRFQRLRRLLDEALGKQSQVDLKLSANAEKGELTISAEAVGLKNPGANLRLRLVLAEDKIDYLAPNGIRIHEMVVRDMPAGAVGVAPQNGTLKFSNTSSLAALKQQLIDYLAAYEAGQRFEFPVKPLDLDKLHLVAFVQDDGSKEILQAAAVPVSGKLEYPENLKPSTVGKRPNRAADGDSDDSPSAEEPAGESQEPAAPADSAPPE